MSFFTIAGEKRKKRGSKLLAFKKISFFPTSLGRCEQRSFGAMLLPVYIWRDAFNSTWLDIWLSLIQYMILFCVFWNQGFVKNQKCIGFRNLTVCLLTPCWSPLIFWNIHFGIYFKLKKFQLVYNWFFFSVITESFFQF